MWNDLDMHDRHKLIKLAVTNGVYDLDTIHSLYDNNEYKDGGNMRIAPYKDNASYPDRKLYRNVKKDFRKDPEAEYKDYEDYGVRVYNPSISSDAPNRKERQDIILDRIKQDFPDIQKNDVKKTAFKSNSLGWHNNTTGYMGAEDKRTLFGLQQNYDFVNNIVPYAKLGMETPESIQRREELERRNRNTTFDYTNNFDIGGDLPTDPDRPIIDTQPIIDKIRANNLAKYAMRDSTLQQIQDLTNRMYEEEIKRRTMEWLNPSNYTDKGDMVNALRVPVAEARPTFINTYELGGPKDPPYDWTKAWTDAQSISNEAKPKGHYNVVATDGKNSNYNYEKNVTPDLSWYKDPLENTRMVTEEPIEPLYGFKDPVFNVALLGAGLTNGAFKGAGTLLEDLATPGKTFVTKIAPRTGLYVSPKAKLGAYVGDVVFNAINTGNGISDLMSNNGINKTVQLLNNEDYGNAITSGLGDVLNALPLFNGPRLIRNFNSYRKQGNNIKNAINRTITGYTDRDLEHLAYFNMSPKEVAKQVNKDMNSINIGGKFLEGNLSTDSYPLVLHSMLFKNSPNFKVYNTGKMMELNRLGNLTGEQALGRINKKK